MPTITSLSGAFTQLLPATLTRISLTPSGGQADGFSGFFDSTSAQVFSGDGRRIVFETQATNIVPGDANGASLDAVARELFSGATTRVSLSASGAQASATQSATLSADGRYVFFASSDSSVVPNDTNASFDIFRRDLLTGAVVRATTRSRRPDRFDDSTIFSTSADGRYVVFASAATTLVAGDTNAQIDVFRKDLVTGAVERVSTATGGAQATGGVSIVPSISADGRYVVFQSSATNLVTGDTNGVADIFSQRHGCRAPPPRRTTASQSGHGWSQVNARISADGR